MPEWVFFILDKVVLSLFIGVVTSVLFFFILSRYKPVIKISPRISKRYNNNKNTYLYLVKIINKTKHPIVDINVEFIIKTPIQTANGEVWRVKKIPFEFDSLLSLGEFKKNDNNAKFSYRFGTEEDLESIWIDDHQLLTFKIYAKHSLSGFGGFFEQDYSLKRASIIEGIFSRGDTFEIK